MKWHCLAQCLLCLTNKMCIWMVNWASICWPLLRGQWWNWSGNKQKYMPCWRPRHRWEADIKMDLMEVGWKGIWLRSGASGWHSWTSLKLVVSKQCNSLDTKVAPCAKMTQLQPTTCHAAWCFKKTHMTYTHIYICRGHGKYISSSSYKWLVPLPPSQWKQHCTMFIFLTNVIMHLGFNKM